jgi:CBS-domain-containing membrane protein
MTNLLHPRTAADIMTIDPVVVAVDAPIDEAERLIRTYRVSGLPVIDAHGGLVGVISQTDFLYLARPEVRNLIRRQPSGIRVGEIMSSPAITVGMATQLTDVARTMRDERVHRVVVVDEQQRPIGVVSAMDLVTVMADYQTDDAGY